MKEKCFKAEERLMKTEDGLAEANSCINELYDQQEYLENHYDRNDVKFMGIPENEHGILAGQRSRASPGLSS